GRGAGGREGGEGAGGADRRGRGTGDVERARAPPLVPGAGRRPAEGEEGDPDGDIEVEDVAPRVGGGVEQRPADADRLERSGGVDRLHDPGTRERTRGHAHERHSTPPAQRPRPGTA